MLYNPVWSKTRTTELDVLTAARKIIERPENWLGRCPENDEVPTCALGALLRARTQLRAEIDTQALANKIEEWAGITNIVAFNDTHSHADVLAVFDRAIANAAN